MMPLMLPPCARYARCHAMPICHDAERHAAAPCATIFDAWRYFALRYFARAAAAIHAIDEPLRVARVYAAFFARAAFDATDCRYARHIRHFFRHDIVDYRH